MLKERERLLREFKGWLMSHKYGEGTISHAESYVRSFLSSNKKLNEISEWVEEVAKKRRLEKSSRYNVYYYMGLFQRFLQEKGLIVKDELSQKEDLEPEYKQVMEEILEIIKQRYAYHTYKQTREHVRAWLLFLQKRGIKPEEAGPFEAELFLSERTKERRLKPASVASYVSNLRRFYYFLSLKLGRNVNPFAHIKVRRTRPLPRYLDIQDIIRLFKAAKDNPRDYALVTTLFFSGIRAKEAAELRWRDVNIRARELIIRGGKGGVDRIAFISDIAAQALAYWKAVTKWGTPEDRVFLIKKPENIIVRVRKVGEKAGIYVTAHMLRHSLGHILASSGMSVRYIQEILGHRDVKNTQIYTQLTKREIKRAYEEFWGKFSKTIEKALGF